MIPTTFPPRWRAAVERGDASGFNSAEDVVAFFDATSNAGCFFSLSDDQREHVADLRSRDDLANLFTASAQARHARERKADTIQANAAAPRFILGRTTPDHIPTLSELKPELAAIDAEINRMPKATSWAKAVSRTNARLDALHDHGKA